MSSPVVPSEPIAVDLRDYVEFDLSSPSARRVFATDVLAVDLLSLEPHQVVDARTFPTADVIYTVLGGRAWAVTDEAEVTLEPLQSVMVPAGVPHGLRNDAPDPLIVQVVISPPDEAPEASEGPAAAAETERRPVRVQRPGDTPRRPLLDRLRRTLGG
jgi:quercetin dioxygenase-like cupin family protein